MTGKMNNDAYLEDMRKREKNYLESLFLLGGYMSFVYDSTSKGGFEMDLKTRQEIIDKIKACPIEKCGNRGLRNDQYEETKRLTINLIESMDENNQLIIQYEDGEEQLITVNVNNVLLSYDPIEVDDD
jgi:hypothetical protein